MIGVILAAGMAKRLRPLTDTKPKCLLTVDGKTLLQRTVDAMLQAGITEFVVVTGYRADQIRDFLTEQYGEQKVSSLSLPHHSPFTPSQFVKPISCALYPIREKTFNDGTVGLNYHRWAICQCGRDKGRQLHLPLYQFLKEPLTRRFGKEWYDELCAVAETLKAE